VQVNGKMRARIQVPAEASQDAAVTAALADANVQKFAEGNAANTYTLPGTPHYVYISHEAEVVRWMRKFLGIPARS